MQSCTNLLPSTMYRRKHHPVNPHPVSRLFSPKKETMAQRKNCAAIAKLMRKSPQSEAEPKQKLEEEERETIAQRKNCAGIAKLMQKCPRAEAEPKQKLEGETMAQRLRDLPLDIISEILSRAQVNDLVKWKCVSKSWLELISSPKFIRMHMNRSKERSRVLMAFPQAIIDYEDARRMADRPGKKIQYPPGICCGKIEIVGSCDGLICLIDRCSTNIVIFNPSTRNFCCVGAANYYRLSFYWFGHHPSTGDNSLVMGRTHYFPQGNPITELQVLNLNSKCKSRYLSSVDQRNQDDNYFFEKIGTLLHETLHWPACAGPNGPNRSRYKVVTYDFKKNEIVEIPAPGGVTGYESYFTLGVLDGCLFAIFRPGDIFELWIMKEYGVKESWTKSRNIEGYVNFKFLTPLGFSSDGELIIDADRSVLTKYSFTEKMATVLNIRKSDNTKAIIFRESLLSFDFSVRVRCYHCFVNVLGETKIGSVILFNSNCLRCWERITKKTLSPEEEIFYSQTRKKWMLRRSRNFMKPSKKESAGKKTSKVLVVV